MSGAPLGSAYFSRGAASDRVRLGLGGSAITSIGAVAAAALIGYALAFSPRLILAVSIGIVVVGVLAYIPLRHMASVMIVATAIVPSVILLQPTGLTPIFGGPLKALGMVAGVTLLKVTVLQRRVVERPPGVALLAAGISALAISVAALNASLLQHSPSGLIGNETRALAFMLAGLVGYLSVTAAHSRSERAGVYRLITLVATAIAMCGVWYWAWLQGTLPAPPGLQHLFLTVRATSEYTSTNRTNFPYVSDAPNMVAVAYIFVMVFAVAGLRFNSDRSQDKRLGLIAIIAAAAGVAATGSRTGFVCMIVAGVAYLLLRLRDTGIGWRVLQGASAAVVLIVLTPVLLPRSSELSAQDTTFVGRVEIWSQALHAFYAKPLLGWGLDYSAGERFLILPRPGASPTARLTSIHNQYLAQLVDGGLLGVVLLVAVGILLVLVAVYLIREPVSAGEGFGFAYFLVVLAVASAVASTLASSVGGTLVWLICGMAFGRLGQLQQRPRHAHCASEQAVLA